MDNQEMPTVATVGVAPSSAAGELALLQGIGGSNSMMLVMTILAIVGGRASWKFWGDWRKQKHLETMKRMELEAQIKLAEIQEENEKEQEAVKPPAP